MATKFPDSIKSFTINMTDAAAQRPVLAIEASRLFAMWAMVEFMLGSMTSVLFGDAVALAMLDRIRAKSQKMDAIRAAAAEKIPHAETRDLLKPLFRLLDKAAEPRNQLAHCLWGTLDELPDALLLTDTEAAIKAGRLTLQAQGKRSSEAHSVERVSFEHSFEHKFKDEAEFKGSPADQIMSLLRNGTRVWRQSDFDTPRLLLGRASVALTLYTTAIGGAHGEAATVQARKQLSDLLGDTERFY